MNIEWADPPVAICNTRTTRVTSVTTLTERLWRRVDTSAGSTGCWPWTGSVDSSGYGAIGADGRTLSTHRLAYELSTGKPIPDGMYIDHICHVTRCCNPAHLRVVTGKQNAEHRSGASRNSRSGIRGVYQTRTGRWEARLMHNGKVIQVGTFDTVEEAGEAVRLKRLELFTHNDVDRRSFSRQ